MVVTQQDAASLGAARPGRRAAVRARDRVGHSRRTPALRAGDAGALGGLRPARDDRAGPAPVDHRRLTRCDPQALDRLRAGARRPSSSTGGTRLGRPHRPRHRASARRHPARADPAGAGSVPDVRAGAVPVDARRVVHSCSTTSCCRFARRPPPFVGYLPNLLFVVVIARDHHGGDSTRRAVLRADSIRAASCSRTFPPEWADPTNKIVRVLLIAFGVVVAFPYLPASDSPAFAGVSVFMGVLFSLASSSALSNMIAGLVLTYTGAFRLGDRVKIGDTFGDIVETSLLATRVRTIKNEDITIPNSLVLGSSVINYSRARPTLGLILHTSVTIGYDAPWRTIHGLLIEAALATPGVLAEPPPFVWQTALNDFYVTYEINAYTGSPRDMTDIYAALHARIQDTFYAAGVEIMSPHFTALRDGNTVAIPESFRPPGYRPPAFRVEHPTSGREASRNDAGVAPSV